MTIRLWRPDNEGPSDELSLLACVASTRYLYVILEGPSLPAPRDPWSDEQEMLLVHVTTSSGVKVRPYGMSTGSSSKRGQQCLAQLDPPPEPSEPLTVRLTTEDGSTIWEVQAFPVG